MDSVLPILSPSGAIYWLECRFPPAGPQSGRLSVQTVVNNALVGQWLKGTGAEQGDGTFVQQQVTERLFLRQLMAGSEECSQRIHIRWPPMEEGSQQTGANTTAAGAITAETLAGQKLEFRRNSSVSGLYEEAWTIQSGPILQIGSPSPADVSLGPLLCRQILIPRPECQFELRSDSDRIRLKLPLLRKKAASFSSGPATLSVAFRTGRPNGGLLELLDGGNGPLGALDLVDGQLLFANHITHPAKLLADGLWHSLHLDLHSLSLRVDDSGTALSLRATADEGDPLWLDLLAHGELAAIRLLAAAGLEGAGPEHWLCGEEPDLMDVRQSTPKQNIFAQPSVCSPSSGEKNFCNCRGPNSALAPNGGIGRQSVVAQCESLPAEENAFHLSRLADRLAFFLVPNFGPKTPISILFKTEKPTGLLFFGLYSTPFSAPRSSPGLGPSGARELGGRVQVHFVGPTLFGAICSHLADGSEKCLTCAIRMDQAPASDRWRRVSLSYQLNQQFLSVDRQVCLLSPNAHAVDPAELYRISAVNVLLVGGAFYTKHALLSQRVADQFRRDFQDNTREKAPSLEGCVAEVLVRGQRQNLSYLLSAQAGRARRAQQDKGAETAADDGIGIFSIRPGCPHCPAKCNGAPCTRNWSQEPPTCQCHAIYAAASALDGGCRTENEQTGTGLGGGLRLEQQQQRDEAELAFSLPIREPPGLRGRPRSRLERIWLLLRLPQANARMHPLIGIGSLEIGVGENGRRVVVESRDYGLMEEFLLPQAPDSRLHLLAIERNPGIGTGANGHLLTIRLDGDRRPVPLEEVPVTGMLDGGQAHVQIRPLPGDGRAEAVHGAGGGGGGGCIQELVFHYAPGDEPLSTMAFGLHEPAALQQLDYVDQIREQFPSLFPLPGTANCGIRDPALWSGNSSSWGRLGEAVDDGEGAIGFILKRGSSSLPRISVLVTSGLILLLLIVLSAYLFHTLKGHYSEENGCTSGGGTGKCHFDKLRASEHERRPLKLVTEEEDGGGRRKTGQKQQPNGQAAAKNGEMLAPPRPPKSPREGTTDYFVLVNGTNGGWKTGEGPLSIQPMDGSPKPIGPSNGALRVTPLRSQPLRNGSGRFQVQQSPQQQSPPASQRAQFFMNSPAPSEPNNQRSPVQLNNQQKPLQWSSAPGSAGFFTPSPTSANSSTSPGSSSLHGNHDLMRPPIARVAATSRQHSPIGGASAPIVCKEEL